MSTGSLRLRLLLVAAIFISVALGLAGLASYYQFRKQVAALTLTELNAHFEQLVANIVTDENGAFIVEGRLSDPRFEKQFGGLYWQVEMPNLPPMRSRSLWDEVLKVPTPPLSMEDEHVHEIAGPNNSVLLSLEKTVNIEREDGTPVPAVVTVGIAQDSVSNAARNFGSDIANGLGILYLVLLASSLGQILIGLHPLEAVRKHLESIRSGKIQRMDQKFPSEVQPLVTEINSLLASREQQLDRARQRAGNLAHGLKSPLTILDVIAGDLQSKGKHQSAAEILSAASDMRILIERELSRARASADNRYVLSKLSPAVLKVFNTLRKIPGRTSMQWINDVPADIELPIEMGDLLEVLGNLIENASKHAKSSIRVSSEPNKLIVEDDGMGVPDDQIRDIIRRGVKLDEFTAGTGLGLAIVHDLAEVYGANVMLDRSPLGGLRVAFVFKSKIY